MSSPRRAIVIGAGSISKSWFGPLKQENVQVAAVVDLNLESARKAVEQYQFDAIASDDLDQVLADTQADFALDLTVPEAHCNVVCKALKAGLHVIGEKPMASSMDEARNMVATSEKTGRLYMVSQSRRWLPLHDQFRRAIATGQLGALTIINCDFYTAPHFGGFRDQMPSPLILDMAIHHFDLARFFSGASPRAVYAHEFNPRGSWYAGDASATCIFEMSDGIVFTYRGSWCAEGCPTSWNGHWRVIGQQGTLILENEQPPVGEVVAGELGFRRPTRPAAIELSPMPHTQTHGALREMLAFLDTGRKPQTECHDNIQSLAMVLAAMESSRRRQRMTIEL
ncbi:MAG: Gfo/Idh/MocA family oxidoreductase [Phycisphaeraceae bacterium]|nr:Gfo/Idh/MocA family oxidoreductase [Phycisphaeraceae bacterium]